MCHGQPGPICWRTCGSCRSRRAEAELASPGITKVAGGQEAIRKSLAELGPVRGSETKLRQLELDDFWAECWGDGDLAMVTFSSSILPAREAARRLRQAGRMCG